MADITRRLGEDEELVLDLHPHGRALVLPFLAVPLVAGLASYAGFAAPDSPLVRDGVLVAAVVLLVLLSVTPYVRWRTTRYVVTDRRVLLRSGLFGGRGRDVPLYRILDVFYENTLTGRLLGSGDLVLDTGEEQDEVRLADVPRVEQVQRTLAELLEEDDDRRLRRRRPDGFRDEDDLDAPPPDGRSLRR